MRRIFVALVLAVTFFFAASAEAATTRRLCKDTKRLMNEVALNGLIATRTFTVDYLEGWDILKLDVQFTHANNGALTLACTSKSSKAADVIGVTQVDSSMTQCSWTSGVCTLDIGLTWATASLTADADYSIMIGVVADEELTCSITHGGSPAAGDKATVTGKKCVAGFSGDRL